MLKGNRCKLCGKRGEYKCSKCGKVCYCSRECQFKDWTNHKDNCRSSSKSKKIKNRNSSLDNKKVSFSSQIQMHNEKDHNIIHNEKSNNDNSNDHNQKSSKRSRNISCDLNMNRDRKSKARNSSVNINNDATISSKNKNISTTGTTETATVNNETILKEQKMPPPPQNDKAKKEEFDFMQSLKEIIFMKKNKNKNKNTVEEKVEDEEEESEMFEDDEKFFLKNDKILLLYKLLIKHRNYVIEKVLLDPSKTYFFAKTVFFRDKFIEIEKYIFNFIILIRFLYNQTDPVSLIKANQALNYLASEMLDYRNNGLLVHSINTIIKRCLVVIKSNTVYQNIGYCHEVMKKYLLLLSCLIKISKQLEIPKLYYKFLDHYGKLYELALNVISTSHVIEKTVLKSNLFFNVAGLFVERNLLNSSIKLYKQVLDIQSHLEPYSFVYGASYYNISILSYVMGNIKACDLYLNEIIEKTTKIEDLVKIKKYKEDLGRFKCKLLLFNAEVNMEKEKYKKAIENLKEVIDKIEKASQKERHKTQQTSKDKKFNYFINNMKNYVKGSMSKNNLGKSNSIVSNMIIGLSKEKNTSKKKVNDELSNVAYLYMIDYFNNPLEKIHFNEKIKEIVNGLLDAILFIQNEKELKIKESQYYQKYSNKKNKKSDTEINKHKKLKSSSVVYETEGALLDFGTKALIGRVKRNDKGPYSHSNERKKNRCITKKESYNQKLNSLSILGNKNPENKNKEEKDNYYVPETESQFVHEKTVKKILSYIKDDIVKKIKIINNEGDISDFKYFFILLTNLSFRQIEILNNTQNSNMPSELYKNLPIFFSRQFKNTLNPAQRNLFEKLRILSLIRCKVLADPFQQISVDNFNFSIFHANIRFNEIKLRQYSDVMKIVREVMESGYGVFKRKSIRYTSSYRSQRQNSQDLSINNANKNINKNEYIKKYISKKSKQMQQYEIDSNNSSEDDESKEESDNENIDFKYRNQFDFKKFRNKLIEDINYSYMIYSQDDISNMILLVKSPLFVQMMNSLQLSSILELEKDNSILIELLIKEIKRIEKTQIDQIKKKEDDLSSDSSNNDVDVIIDEKDLNTVLSDLKPKYSVDLSNFKVFHNKMKDLRDTKRFGRDSDLDLSEKFNKFINKEENIQVNDFNRKSIQLKKDD